MPAPVAASMILLDDTTNTGDKLRTQTRVIGGNTVHEYFVRPVMAGTLVGRYWFSEPSELVSSTAFNGTTGAQLYLQNPVASTVVGVLRRITFDGNTNNITAAAVATIISVKKFTFTGVASGLTSTSSIVSSSTSGTSSQMKARVQSSGMTITLGLEVTNFQLPSSQSATGICWGSKEAYPFNPLAFGRGSDLEFAPGEGLVIYQNTAGAATNENRYFGFSLVWDEFDPS